MIRIVAAVICILALASVHVAGTGPKPMKYSVLAINYIGESDKPISPIVISDSQAGAEWYRSTSLKRDKVKLTYVHVISVALLEQLIAEAKLFEGTLSREQKEIPKSGEIVSVTIINPQKNNTLLLDKESAISYLDTLQERCTNYESLRSNLLHFQKRIRS